MENAIPTRIQGFLKKYPPFSMLNDEELLTVAERVVIRYFQPGEYIFRQGESPGKYIFVVREGAIRLYDQSDQVKELVDVCDEGDIFGLRPVLAADTYVLTACADEESLVYAVDIDTLNPCLDRHPDIALYLAKSFATGRGNGRYIHAEKKLSLGFPASFTAYTMDEVQRVEYIKKPVTCPMEFTVKDAAKKMKDNNVGSIIVVDNDTLPAGIITDRDLRDKVLAGDCDPEARVTSVMSSPVITIPPDQSMAVAQMEMIQHGIHHLCVTSSGKDDTPVEGIISEHDLLVMQGSNPAILVKEIKRCQSVLELKRIRDKAENLMGKYLEQEVSISFISRVMTSINDELTRKAIDISKDQLLKRGKISPSTSWCWMSIGSGGREEQLLRTDQDSALVFQDPPDDEKDSIKKYLLAMAERTVAILRECGFGDCPADMMASNPKWCLSVSEWKDQFSRWIKLPTEQNVMYSTIFFDFRPIYGNPDLTSKLSQHIFSDLDPDEMFFVNLSKNAIQTPPPLTFFRNFMVEKGGEHKDEFDIKARAMMPLIDTARILILHAKVPNINNTMDRFLKMADLEPQNEELYLQAADAYEILLKYRAYYGLKNNNSGRFLDPSELSKMERLNLRNCFKPIHKLQELLMVRYRVSIFM